MQAIGQSGRHIFWVGGALQPRPSTPRRLGLLPLYRMGQSTNRLDGLSIAAIQNRILISPLIIRFQEKLAAYAAQFGFRRAPTVLDEALGAAMKMQFPTLTQDEAAILTAIEADPTDEELADLTLIDGFFNAADAEKFVNAHPGPTLTEGVCAALDPKGDHGLHGMGMASYAPPPTPAGVIGKWLLYEPPSGRGWSFGRNTPNASSDEIDSIKGSSFFCAAPQSWPYPNKIQIDWPSFFGIDQNQSWGVIKLQVKNAITIMNSLNSYPFPPPIDIAAAQFWYTVQGDLQKYVQGERIEPEGFRFWITIQVLQNYNDIVDRMEAVMKRKAKKAKRKAIMTAIGLAIVSIIAPYLLPAIVVATAALIQTVIQTYMDLQARRKAAKEMAETAKLFEADAPAFAVEVRDLADMMDSQAAQAEASIPLPPDLLEELGSPAPAIHPLVFGTGIAAAIGLTALAIFRK